MKSLHRPDLWCWSEFNAERNLDFHSYFWQRPEGNVAIDPLPLSEHDAAHVAGLGGVAWILISNADHTRATSALQARWGAKLAAPKGDAQLPVWQDLTVHSWMAADELLPCGIQCLGVQGSKTPGELAFVLPPGDTLYCGDLVRGQRAGTLNLLPPTKLSDPRLAAESVRKLANLREITAVLVGDGWPVFVDGGQALRALADRLGGG